MLNYLLAFLIVLPVFAAKKKAESVFSGRVVETNRVAKVMRLEINFANSKYLRTRDKISFWVPSYPSRQCKASVMGKSTQFLVLRVEEFAACMRKVGFGKGSYLHLGGEDFEFNLELGKEINEILIKKRMVLSGKVKRLQIDLETFDKKIDVINHRYRSLQDQLQKEWTDSVNNVEVVRTDKYKNLKQLESELMDLDFKLEQYRVEDKSLKKDRWALDPKNYVEK